MFNKDADYSRGAASFAGLAGGVAMMLVLMVYAADSGDGFLHPLNSIAGFWSGVTGPDAASNAFLIGLLTHLGASFGLGAPLGWTTDAEHSVARGALSGLLYGLTVWVFMTFAVVPSFNEATADWVRSQPGWLWLGAHLVYGAVCGALTPPIDRMLRGW